MRTTERIDPDLAERLRGIARERGVSFAEALNGYPSFPHVLVQRWRSIARLMAIRS